MITGIKINRISFLLLFNLICAYGYGQECQWEGKALLYFPNPNPGIVQNLRMDILLENGEWKQVAENGSSPDPALKLPFTGDIRTVIVPDPGREYPKYKVRMRYDVAFQKYR